MKVVFLQKEPFPYFGVMSLAGSLRKAGIESSAVIDNLEKDVLRSVRDRRPDLIAISLITTEHAWLAGISRRIRSAFPDTPIIVGGVHAILYPQEVMKLPEIDYVCIGDGEETLTEVCEKMQRGMGGIERIPGLGYRRGATVLLNERAPLFEELSGHFEDRSVYYDRYPELRDDELKQFIASRGCPYSCAFCFNKELQDLFKGKGKYVRMKEPRHFIEEIERVRANAPVSTIYFADDLFTMNKKWLAAFVPLYRERINIPFMCTTRANLMDDEIAELLRYAGCHTVSFGIETGNEHLRREVLKKDVANREIIACAATLRRRGIRIQTSNMFCLPDETFEDALATVSLNIAARTSFSFSTLFLPFPGTRLAQYCIERNYLPNNFNFSHLPRSFLTHSILQLGDKDRIENLQRVSFFMIRYPSIFSFMKGLVQRYRGKMFFYPFLFLGTFLRYKQERKISFLGAARFLWRFRRSF